MSETERYEAVRHCRYVDEVVIGAPYAVDEEFLERHKIDFVAHDDLPYEGDIYGWLKVKGMFLAAQRTEGVSTSDLIARIVTDYDTYVRRNLSRGYAAKDMKVSYINGNRFTITNRVEKVKSKGMQLVDQVADQSAELIHKWESNSREFIGAFLQLFGLNRFSQFIAGAKQRIAKAISPAPSDDESEEGEETSAPLEAETETETEAEDGGVAAVKQPKLMMQNDDDARDFSDGDD